MRLLFALLFMVMSACEAKPPVAAPPPAETSYHLSAGDKVRVDTFGEAGLSGEFVVDGAGQLSFPLLGAVAAAGRTAEEIAATITAGLAGKALRDPRVTVQVLSFRPVYVLGEVTRPGEFAFAPDLSVFALVAKAGGFTYRADKRRVYIRHAGKGDEIAYRLTPATPVRPGDTVRIGERFF